jgi:hypothetical protein
MHKTMIKAVSIFVLIFFVMAMSAAACPAKDKTCNGDKCTKTAKAAKTTCTSKSCTSSTCKSCTSSTCKKCATKHKYHKHHKCKKCGCSC